MTSSHTKTASLGKRVEALECAAQVSLAAHIRCLPQIRGVLPEQDTKRAIELLNAALTDETVTEGT